MQLEDMVSKGIITSAQAELVDRKALAVFFFSPIGILLRSAENVLREFKFSILDEGSSFGEGLDGESILLQGVVDCAIMDDDGITIIDFKTDRISEKDLDAAVRHYRYQIEAYAASLSRIFEKPIKRTCLYFFNLNQCVDV